MFYSPDCFSATFLTASISRRKTPTRSSLACSNAVAFHFFPVAVVNIFAANCKKKREAPALMSTILYKSKESDTTRKKKRLV